MAIFGYLSRKCIRPITGQPSDRSLNVAHPGSLLLFVQLREQSKIIEELYQSPLSSAKEFFASRMFSRLWMFASVTSSRLLLDPAIIYARCVFVPLSHVIAIQPRLFEPLRQDTLRMS